MRRDAHGARGAVRDRRAHHHGAANHLTAVEIKCPAAEIAADLHRGQELVHVVLQALDPGGGAAALRDEAFDAAPSGGDDRDLAPREEAVAEEEEILRGQLRSLRTNFPRARIWIKAGPFRDLLPMFRVASQERVDAVLVDGKEGGTGAAPTTVTDSSNAHAPASPPGPIRLGRCVGFRFRTQSPMQCRTIRPIVIPMIQ